MCHTSFSVQYKKTPGLTTHTALKHVSFLTDVWGHQSITGGFHLHPLMFMLLFEIIIKKKNFSSFVQFINHFYHLNYTKKYHIFRVRMTSFPIKRPIKPN